jgi:starch-binding outer membrane protein, SusD/RagB family
MPMRSVVLFFLLLIFASPACKKAFLDKLPSSALVVPSTLTDYQNILNNNNVMAGTPVLGDVSADNLALPYSFWQTLDTREYNAYVWAVDIYEGQGLVDDWDVPYQQVFYANVVLQGLTAIPIVSSNRQQWQNEQAEALFFRAYAFFNLTQLFAPPYDSATAATDPGIPLRLTPDVTTPSVRASVQDSYRQILTDLQLASPLLPPAVPYNYRNLPSHPADLALQARVYLSMRNYPLAGLYADSALQLYDSLIDYNTVPTATIFPFSTLNAEVLYQSSIVTYTQCLVALEFPDCLVDSVLYASYSPNDLRQSLFFLLNYNNQPTLNTSYAGSIFPFTGLATDELYLIRAECNARAGQTAAALADLNTLLQHRYATGTFTPVTAPSAPAALDSILIERRKELPFRGVRWPDLRRLNLEGYNLTPVRNLNGTLYSLAPNSNLYTLPIPPDVITDNPGMMQNPR